LRFLLAHGDENRIFACDRADYFRKRRSIDVYGDS
jgi:hypothetical protein